MSENFESTYEDSLKKIRESVEKAPIYSADHTSQAFWQEDGVSLTGNSYFSPDTVAFTGSRVRGGFGEDHLVLNPPLIFSPNVSEDTNSNGFWKYEEDKTLKSVENYIKSTYNSHYASENSKVQVIDIIDAIGDGVPFCRDNLIKYSSRFGKKGGMSKLDALKIIHYGILLYHFAGFHKTSKSDFPY
ncbi:MAG: DUF3310 domain-containing protein [Flavobacteriales bacterium]|nr:DUF3310 domain-containing protein [Flavobacteriales bacterium]